MQPFVSANCVCSFRIPYGQYAQIMDMRGSDNWVGRNKVTGLSETLENHKQIGCKQSLFLLSGQPKLTPSLVIILAFHTEPMSPKGL